MTATLLPRTDQIRILIVEDDEDDAFLVEEMLSDGITMNLDKVDRSENFLDALTMMLSKDYDICIFDYNLGKNTGVDLLVNVRSKGIEVPVIFLTGNTDPEIKKEIKDAGAVDLFFKSNISSTELSYSILRNLNLV